MNNLYIQKLFTTVYAPFLWSFQYLLCYISQTPVLFLTLKYFHNQYLIFFPYLRHLHVSFVKFVLTNFSSYKWHMTEDWSDRRTSWANDAVLVTIQQKNRGWGGVGSWMVCQRQPLDRQIQWFLSHNCSMVYDTTSVVYDTQLVVYDTTSSLMVIIPTAGLSFWGHV